MSIAKLLASLSSEKDVEEVLTGLLTTRERQSIEHRLEIVRLIRHGIPHREIAKTLGVGIATVTRGAAEVKNGTFSFLDHSDHS
jgi:TrpR family trp operon transcriptional repressor